MNRNRKASTSLAASHLLSSCAAFVAIGLFVFTASEALSPAFGGFAGATRSQGLLTALCLNIALVIFAWRRSSALGAALSARAVAEALAHENAFTDHVTGLGNRRQLIAAIDAPAGAACLLLLDLDHFKQVNDLHGHPVGDRLLRHVGETLRDLAPDAACCARLGGDEFGVLLRGPDSEQLGTALAGEMVAALAEPVTLDGVTAQVTASIGLASSEAAAAAESVDGEALLRRSDIAMYAVKKGGRNGFAWFDAEMGRQLDRHSRLEGEMRAGIERGEFVPFFQPQYSLATGALQGFEVLARWNHPERGMVEPLDFIDIAEATGLISPLSQSVMRQALAESRGWSGKIAVNISPIQFRDPLLAQRILQILAETGFPAGRLEIEITESALLEDQAQALATVESLKNNGISISLDDFGTGYASLTQLKSLPFDRIKIDKSFVSALLSDAPSNAIVTTIAGLGRSLQLPVTAEGVETEDVRARLKALGCDDGQGWLWAKAVPADIAAAIAAQARLDEIVPTPEVLKAPKASKRTPAPTSPRKRRAA